MSRGEAQELTPEKVEALLRQATPGPWRVRSGPYGSFVEGPKADPGHPYNIEILGEDETLYPTRDADVEFVALLPDLAGWGLVQHAAHLAAEARAEAAENTLRAIASTGAQIRRLGAETGGTKTMTEIADEFIAALASGPDAGAGAGGGRE